MAPKGQDNRTNQLLSNLSGKRTPVLQTSEKPVGTQGATPCKGVNLTG